MAHAHAVIPNGRRLQGGPSVKTKGFLRTALPQRSNKSETASAQRTMGTIANGGGGAAVAVPRRGPLRTCTNESTTED